jgi:predicted  nucleic acid-binding Zn-ribbon protein
MPSAQIEMGFPMKGFVHEIVGHLLELHRSEERLTSRDPDERADAQALVASLRAAIPKAVLIVHDQARTRGKRSVAEVRRGVCSGCHLALGVGNVAALRAGELRRCGNCGRYVFVGEVDGEETPAAKPRGKSGTRSLKPSQ